MVISVKMLGPGSDPAGYYASRQAGCTADYYLDGEQAGRWLGSGATAAELSGRPGEAGAQVLRALLEGKAPDGGVLVRQVLRADARGRLEASPLVQALRIRAAARAVDTVDLFAEPNDRAAYRLLAARADAPPGRRTPTVDPRRAARLADAAGLDVTDVFRTQEGDDRYAAAAKFAGHQVDVRRPGIDVTASAPKSVSVLWGLGDPVASEAVLAAHREAVGQALQYLESVAGHGLRGHQGDGQRADRIGTDGWIAAAFEHRTSRAGDPQLHTHLVVPNLLRGSDGKWSAIDSRAVFRHTHTASYVYHAVLRGELTRRLGVGWTAPVKGVAEIAGLPDDLLDTFSTRRRQILAAMRAAGRSGPKAAQAACLATRPDKPPAESEAALRQRWVAAAEAAGHLPARVVGAVLGRVRPPVPPPIDRIAQHLLGPAGLTAQATGFDRRDLLQALCQALPPGQAVDLAALERAADRVLQSRDAVRLAARCEEGPRWSTTELLGVEQAGLRLADELRSSTGHAVDLEAAELADVGRGLSEEQQRMSLALARVTGLAVVVGPAGAGKTAALAAAHRAWLSQGRPVLGAAVAAVTARRLEHATGMTLVVPDPPASRRPAYRPNHRPGDRPPGQRRRRRRRGLDGRHPDSGRTAPRSPRPPAGPWSWSATRPSCPRSAPAGCSRRSPDTRTPSSSPTTADRSNNGSEPR